MAFTIGILAYERILAAAELFVSSWLPGALLLGLLFIVIFNLMAVTAQTNGLSVASVASKMSVIIPVIFGVLLYAEQLGPIQVIGILMALAAVFLTSIKKNSVFKGRRTLLYPLLLFLGSGI